jgi:cell wall-associated NlpC family hydrolase
MKLQYRVAIILLHTFLPFFSVHGDEINQFSGDVLAGKNDIAIVCVPVVSVMSRSSKTPTCADEIVVRSRFSGEMYTLPKEHRNPLCCTQLLKGDQVKILKQNDTWLLVRSLEQYVYVNGVKRYIDGWVPEYAIKRYLEKNITETVENKSNQGEFSQNNLHGINSTCNEQAARKKIISFMRHAIGNPYVWGGRSVGKHKVRGEVVGPDCSGLVGLAYKKAGIFIPRNAQSMRHEARAIECGADLQTGDLIFFAHPDNKNSITHVVAYSGNDSVIESKVPEGVIETACTKRFGMSMQDMVSGELYMKPARRLYFGTFFNT